MKRMLAAFAAMAALIAVQAASAHNVAHLTLPDGRCIEVGAGNSPAERAVFQVDKVPETVPALNSAGEWVRDEFGVRWVADDAHPGGTPLERGGCPA